MTNSNFPFICINNSKYQFLEAGQDKERHYTTLIKLDEKYVLFDDDNVLPLFIYHGYNRNSFDFIKRYNSFLKKKIAEEIKTTVYKDQNSTSNHSVNTDQTQLF